MAAGVFGPISDGELTDGTATIQIDGKTRTTALSGNVELVGPPCPGRSCETGFAFFLRGENVSFGSGLFGIRRFVVKDITVGGASPAAGTPRAVVLDESGRGTFAPGTVAGWGRGTGQEKGAFGRTIRSTTQAFVAHNTAPIAIHVDWGHDSFSVDDEFSLPKADDPEEQGLLVETDFRGRLLNQPPSADAGPDRTVECTSPAGAQVVLDGSDSLDPDGNLVSFGWRRGVLLTQAAFSHVPRVSVLQPLGSDETYALDVVDARMRWSRDTVRVRVTDTTPPSIDSLTLEPPCTWPPDHRYVRFDLGDDIQVSASDRCDTRPTIRVIGVSSSEPDDGIGVGDGSTRNDVIFGESGFCVRSERGAAAGDGRTYVVAISATDDAGNRIVQTVRLTVPHDLGARDCEAVRPEKRIDEDEVATRCAFDDVVPHESSHSEWRVLEGATESPVNRVAHGLAGRVPASGSRGGSCALGGDSRTADPVWLLVLVSITRRRRRVSEIHP